MMIYGATGYTGQLVVAEAVASGLRPVVAGRNAEKLAAVAKRWSLHQCAVALDDHDGLFSALTGADVVVNCAGPFSRTAGPMVEACLKTGTHYLDITGEVTVLEALAARDAEAKQAGIMVLPGAGFDVVPSDCLIADLAARHPGGQRIWLGLAVNSGVSRGTLRTFLEGLGSYHIRRNGKLVKVDPGSLRHEFDFGEGPTTAFVSGWGDVATAYRSTGIANIEAYSQTNRQYRSLMWVGQRLGWGFVRFLLNLSLVLGRPGPSEDVRRSSSVTIIAEIGHEDGKRATARLHVPDPYGFTARTVIAATMRVLHGDLKIGYQTPSTAYGADFVKQVHAQ